MKVNDELSCIAREMMRAICVLSLLVIVASIVYHRSGAFLPFAFGVLLGAGLNVCKVMMMKRVVSKTICMEKPNAATYVRLQYSLRFMITGLVLFLSAVLPFINLWGAAAGIFTMPPAAFYAKNFIDGKKGTDGS